MLDGVKLRPHPLARHLERAGELVERGSDLGSVGEAIANQSERRAAPEGEERLLQEVRLGVAVDGDMLDVLEADPGLGQAPAHRLDRQPGPVLDPAEALLLGGGDEQPVAQKAGRTVGVIGVEAEDQGHAHSRSGRWSRAGNTLRADRGSPPHSARCVRPAAGGPASRSVTTAPDTGVISGRAAIGRVGSGSFRKISCGVGDEDDEGEEAGWPGRCPAMTGGAGSGSSARGPAMTGGGGAGWPGRCPAMTREEAVGSSPSSWPAGEPAIQGVGWTGEAGWSARGPTMTGGAGSGWSARGPTMTGEEGAAGSSPSSWPAGEPAIQGAVSG